MIIWLWQSQPTCVIKGTLRPSIWPLIFSVHLQNSDMFIIIIIIPIIFPFFQVKGLHLQLSIMKVMMMTKTSISTLRACFLDSGDFQVNKCSFIEEFFSVLDTIVACKEFINFSMFCYWACKLYWSKPCVCCCLWMDQIEE